MVDPGSTIRSSRPIRVAASVASARSVTSSKLGVLKLGLVAQRQNNTQEKPARPGRLRFGLTSGRHDDAHLDIQRPAAGVAEGAARAAQPESRAASVTRTPPMRRLFDILAGFEQMLLLLEILFVGFAEFLAEQPSETRNPGPPASSP